MTSVRKKSLQSLELCRLKDLTDQEHNKFWDSFHLPVIRNSPEASNKLKMKFFAVLSMKALKPAISREEATELEQYDILRHETKAHN